MITARDTDEEGGTGTLQKSNGNPDLQRCIGFRVDGRSVAQFTHSFGPPLALLAIVLAVHGQSVFFSFVNWDDDFFLLKNYLVTDPSAQPWDHRLLTPQMGYAVPVLMAAQGVQFAVFGDSPFGYHFTNLMVHWLNLWLAFLIAKRLGYRHALFAAILFGFHPITVEPVAWVSGLKDLLAALFVLLGTFVYIGPEKNGVRTWGRVIAATVLFLFAGLSKPTTILAVLIIAVADMVLGTDRIRKRVLRWMFPAATVWSILLVINFPLQDSYRSQGLAPPVWESVTIETMATTERSPAHIAEDVVLAFRTYAENYLAPRNLRAVYIRHRQEGHVSFVALGSLAAILGILALSSLCILGFLKRNAMAFGLLFAFLFYLPASLLLYPLHRMGDPFLYLPCFGLALGILSLVEVMRPKLESAFSALLRGCVAWSVCLFLCFLSFMQVGTWKSGVTLWQNVLIHHPDSPDIRDRLAEAYILENRFPEAAQILKKLEEENISVEGGLTRLAYCYLMMDNFSAGEDTLVLQLKKGLSTQLARRNHALLLLGAWPGYRTRFPSQAKESLFAMKDELQTRPLMYSLETMASVFEFVGLKPIE